MSLSNYFTPTTGLIGGALIGLSAGTLLLFNGDVLGASGLMSSFVTAPKKTLTEPSQQWKLAFLAAFFAAARLYVGVVDPDALKDETGLPIVSPLALLLGGFCVGFGTKLGNGCTSGHGICGLARLSTRSLAAVLTFMATGIASATGIPPSSILRDSSDNLANNLPNATSNAIGQTIASLAIVATLPGFLRARPGTATESERDEHVNNKRKSIPAMFGGAFFSLGLTISQMTVSSKLLGFLNLKGFTNGTGWDPTLVCVMGGGLVVSFISYQWADGFSVLKTKTLECPLSQKSGGFDNIPNSKVIDWKLLLGEAMFGLGWGMSLLCPGPAMVLGVVGYPYVLSRWWPSFFVGSFLAAKVKSFSGKAKSQ